MPVNRKNRNPTIQNMDSSSNLSWPNSQSNQSFQLLGQQSSPFNVQQDPSMTQQSFSSNQPPQSSGGIFGGQSSGFSNQSGSLFPQSNSNQQYQQNQSNYNNSQSNLYGNTSIFGGSKPQFPPNPSFFPTGGLFPYSHDPFRSSFNIFQPTSALKPRPLIQTRRGGRAYSIFFSIETPQNKADITVSINKIDFFQLSSVILIETSGFFQREISEEKIRNKEVIEIETEVPKYFKEVFMWMNYKDSRILGSRIKSFEDLLEIYLIGRLLEIKSPLNLREVLFTKNLIRKNNEQLFSSPFWNRKYLEFDFVKNLLQKEVGLGDSKRIRAILEWLGERRCFYDHQMLEMLNSQEYKIVEEEFKNPQYIPYNLNELLFLAQQYPLTINLVKMSTIVKRIIN